MAVHPIENRYFSDEMRRIWIEENRLQKLLDVEAAIAKAHASVGNIPVEAAEEINKKANLKYVKLERVKELERILDHDIMAVVSALAEVCGEAGKYVHFGATSYDCVDTALALILKDAIGIIEKKVKALKNILLKIAKKHKKTVCIGRTHGQHAIPTTYGMKFGLYVDEMNRHLERIKEVKKRVYIGKLTGAVGTMATLTEINKRASFWVQKRAMRYLGLSPAKITNQVVQRDMHAEVIFILAMIACSLEKIAKEIRNLQRTEIMELAEPFKKTQIGSSTMPHKRNPHKCERICSLARVIRANMSIAFENIPLEHERDLTNSANERIILPESFILLDYLLDEMSNILSNLQFFKENIGKNLEITMGLIMAERVMIALEKKGVGRKEAYEKLRSASAVAFKKKIHLKDILMKDNEIRKYLSEKELNEIFSPETYIGNAIEIVEKIG